VAGGIAEHLGVRVGWVRAAFAVLAALNGAGVMAYGLAWMFVPQEAGEPVRRVSGRERRQALGLAAIGVGVAVAVSTGDAVLGWVVGPLGVASVGAALVWREADETRRRRWAAAGRSGVLGSGGRRGTILRLVTGGVFVACGLATFLLGQVNTGQLQFGLLSVVATLVGVAVLTVPFWVRLSTELGEERRERIRGAERADIAAHLHDSVLQTLALIQRQADQPREVRRLARSQERDLRGWLYDHAGTPRTDGFAHPGTPTATTVAEAVTAIAAEVEDTYAVTISPVVVGDCPLDVRFAALVQAAREAMVNAAKHSGVTETSLYVEVEADAVNVFVRDRGIGFVPEEVPGDRHGLVDSVHGRMQRHGGSASVRTAPGAGTEVHLRMPRPGGATVGQQDGQRREAP
jgi:signal transduction histidine kinase